MDVKEISCDSRLKDVTTITDLPDEILVRILSFLSTEDVVKTVLIRGFGNLWRAVPVLDFSSKYSRGYCEHVNDRVLRMIGHVLNLHDSGTLDKLCIGLVFPKYGPFYNLDERSNKYVMSYPQGIIDCVKKSIVYAMRRKVKILDLNFNVCCSKINNESKLYDISDHHVLVSGCLTDLRLTACGITSCGNVNLKSLKVLFLDEVSLTDAMMDQIQVGCPLLEDLSLTDCLSLGKLTCRNPKLRRLSITRNKFNFCITHVECPHALRLEIIGAVRSVVLLDTSSVVDVSIHVGGGVNIHGMGNVTLDQAFWGLMQKTSHCKIFRAGGWSVEELAMCGYRFRDWPSFSYKSLVLEMSLRMENQPGIALLLKNSHSLETLTLHFHPKEHLKFLEDRFGVGVWETFDRGASYWKNTFPSLVTINIYGWINSRYVIQLVQVLLRCAVRLKKLVISTKDFDCPFGREGYQYTFEQKRQLSHVYKALPIASPEALVYFS